MRLKRWESGRREGRNDKGRVRRGSLESGGTARKRQIDKRNRRLKKVLRGEV